MSSSSQPAGFGGSCSLGFCVDGEMRASIAARLCDAAPSCVAGARRLTEFGEDFGGVAETIGFEAETVDALDALRLPSDADVLRSCAHFGQTIIL